MKTKFIYAPLTYLVMGCQLNISAQNQVNKDKKISRTPEQFTERQTYQMVKTLTLNDATAAKFIPVCQNYLKEPRECRMMNRKQAPARQKVERPGVRSESKPLLTDAEVEQQTKGRSAQSRKILGVHEKYYNELRKTFSSKQIMKIYQTEKSDVNKLKKEFDRRKRQAAVQGKNKHPVRSAQKS